MRGSGQDERDNEAQQGQRLGDGEPEEGVGPGQAGGFRLARRRGDVRGPHNADTDTGADRGEAVTEGADVAGDFGKLVIAASADMGVLLPFTRSAGRILAVKRWPRRAGQVVVVPMIDSRC